MVMKDELKEKISIAFAGKRKPSNIGIYLDDFENLSWQAIPSEVIIQHNFDLSNFTPDGFRYFLPAFLIFIITELDKPTLTDYKIIEEILNIYPSLVPPEIKYGVIYQFLYMASTFEKEEITIIQQFLEYYEVKLSLRGWDDWEIHQLERAKWFWKEALSAPQSLDQKSRSLLAEKMILDFGDAVLPDDDPLYDLDFDKLSIDADIRGKLREELSIIELVLTDSLLKMFSPRAYHYYLPTYLKVMILNPQMYGDFPNNILNTLTPIGKPEPELQKLKKRISLFTKKQKADVVEFLELFTQLEPFHLWLIDKSEYNKIKEAISYWKQMT